MKKEPLAILLGYFTNWRYIERDLDIFIDFL